MPVIDITRQFVMPFNDYLRKQKTIPYLDFIDEIVQNEGKDINPKFAFDGTHLNPSYVSLLEKFLKK